MNIAICDDEQVFLRQLHRKIADLKIPDCQIHEFSSGKELLSSFIKGMYEVIILDVEMPELNGLQTAEKIRQTDKSVIISFLTNYAEFAVQGYEVNAFRYILKINPIIYTRNNYLLFLMNVSSDSEPTNSATGTCLSNSD